MLDFIDLIFDLWAIGATLRALRRLTDGDDQERACAAYDAAEMRRWRLTARLIVLAYLIAIIALPIAGIAWVLSDFWRSQFAGRYFIPAGLIYIGLVWLGFEVLSRIFRRKRQSIAARPVTS